MTLGQLIILLLMALIAAANYLRYRDVLYPPVLHAVVWTTIMAFYTANEGMLIPLSPLLYTVVLGGLALFTVGSFLATRGHVPPSTSLPVVEFRSKDWYAALLYWTPVAGLLPFLLTAGDLGETGPFESFFRNLRHAASEVENPRAGGAFGIWAYLLPISYVSVAIQLLFARYRTAPWMFAISVVSALSYAFFASGRTYVIFFFIMCAGILLITRRVRPGRTFALLGGGGILVFLALGLLVNKGGSVQGGLEISAVDMWQVFVIYLLGSLPAFDIFLHTHIDWGWGEQTFRTVFALLEKLGFEVSVASLVQPYEFVPFPTNVYSVYQPYFSDFAFAGIFLMPIAIGYLHGYLYRKATQGHLLSVLLYALSLYPLFLQFFQDQYLSLLSLWVQYGVLLFLYFYRIRIIPPE